MNSKSLNIPITRSVVEPTNSVNAVSAAADDLGVTVRILRKTSELEELRETWTAWGGQKDSDIDVLLGLVQSRDEVLNPHVVVICRNGKPDAMLIGRLERRKIAFKIGYLPIFKERSRVITFQRGALRGNPSDENCKEAIHAILNSLKSREADLAMLINPRTDSFLFKRALSLPGSLSRDYLPIAQPHRLMRLPDTMEKVYLGLSSKHRKHLRSEEKKIQSRFNGRLKISCFREVAELETAVAHVEEIARKTYQRGIAGRLDDNPRKRDVSHLHLDAKKSWLRIFVLFEGDTPIAFWIGAVYNGWFYSEGTGYDPQYGEYSPGTYLLVKMIETFCKEGLKGIDFGLGDAMYKQRFGNDSFEEATVHLFAPHMKGLLLKVMLTGASATDNALKSLLARTRLLPKVKRLWRDRLARKNSSK